MAATFQCDIAAGRSYIPPAAQYSLTDHSTWPPHAPGLLFHAHARRL